MRRGAAEDEMAGWHHQFSGQEFAPAPGDGEGQGRLVLQLTGCRELNTTQD